MREPKCIDNPQINAIIKSKSGAVIKAAFPFNITERRSVVKRLNTVLSCVLASAFVLSASSCSVPFFEDSAPLGETSTAAVTTEAAAVSVTTAEITTVSVTTVSEVSETEAISSSAASETVDSLPEYEFVMPEYNGSEIIELNGGKPCFSEDELIPEERISFSDLDSLGRCGTAFCCVGKSILPTEERGAIGMVKPAGWHTVKYRCVEGKYLYNRCHLIAYELCGVNADERNLITGTRYLNTEGMLDTENRVRSFVENSGLHVLYRVTPRYEGKELLARGVEIEALSIEDGGRGISLHIFCFNVQPGIIIDHLTGDSTPVDPDDANVEEDPDSSDDSSEVYVPPEGVTYIVNTGSRRFHLPNCQSVQDMKAKNRTEYYGTAEELLALGFVPCGACHPIGDDSEKVG